MTLIRDEHLSEKDRLRPALHELKATPKTVHWGYFDATRAPALKVASGDIIRAEAITHHAGDAPELMMDEGITAIFKGIPEDDRNPKPRSPSLYAHEPMPASTNEDSQGKFHIKTMDERISEYKYTK